MQPFALFQPVLQSNLFSIPFLQSFNPTLCSIVLCFRIQSLALFQPVLQSNSLLYALSEPVFSNMHCLPYPSLSPLQPFIYPKLSQIKFFLYSSLSSNPIFCLIPSCIPILLFALFQHVFQSTLFSVPVNLPIHPFLCYSLSSNPPFSLFQSVFQSTLFSVPICLPIHPFLCSSQSSNPPFSLFQSVFQSTLFSVPICLPIHPFLCSSQSSNPPLFSVTVSLPIHSFLCSSQSSNPFFSLLQSVFQSTLFPFDQSSNPPFYLLQSFSLPKPISLVLYILFNCFDPFRYVFVISVCYTFPPSLFTLNRHCYEWSFISISVEFNLRHMLFNLSLSFVLLTVIFFFKLISSGHQFSPTERL